MNGQETLFDDNAEYEAFVDKFKPKKTTDDCYTPDAVYDAVADWACREYDLDRSTLVRPFWPGADFMAFDYPEDCVVLDNPPFSIITKIVQFYYRHGIRFFLFAPALTLFSIDPAVPVCYIATGADVTYQNGAKIPTSFVTNLDRFRLRTAPELRRAIMDVQREKATASLPKYVYPNEVITAVATQYISKHGVELNILPSDMIFTRALDAQKEKGKAIFGGGFLLSEHAAAERAAAERANAIVWELSERERGLFGPTIFDLMEGGKDDERR